MKQATDILAEYVGMVLVWICAAGIAFGVVGLCVRVTIDLRRWIKDGCP